MIKKDKFSTANTTDNTTENLPIKDKLVSWMNMIAKTRYLINNKNRYSSVGSSQSSASERAPSTQQVPRPHVNQFRTSCSLLHTHTQRIHF